jgi:hypothetical protein
MELQDWSKEAKNLKLGKYIHYKGGEYEVIGISRHTETLEELVVYKSLYGDGGLWTRPLSMFIETTEVNGETINRFEYVGN